MAVRKITEESGESDRGEKERNKWRQRSMRGREGGRNKSRRRERCWKRLKTSEEEREEVNTREHGNMSTRVNFKEHSREWREAREKKTTRTVTCISVNTTSSSSFSSSSFFLWGERRSYRPPEVCCLTAYLFSFISFWKLFVRTAGVLRSAGSEKTTVLCILSVYFSAFSSFHHLLCVSS